VISIVKNGQLEDRFLPNQAHRPHGIAISIDGNGAWRDNVFVERLW